MFAVALALSSSAGWGTADFLGGLCAKRTSVLVVAFVSQVAGLVFTAALLATDLHAPTERTVLLGVLAGVLSSVGLMALYAALAIGPMGVVAPLAALSVAVPVTFGLLRGDHPQPWQLVGVALAVGGVLLASRHRDAAGMRVSGRAVALAVVAALALGGLAVLLSEAGRHDPTWAVLSVRVTAVALIGAAVLVRRPALAVDRGLGLTLVAVGVLDSGANLLFVLASQRGLLSLIAVLASLYPVATVLLARGVLKERLSGPQLAGVAAALAGVVLIASG
jgi:drug/metabolite transporter (DMT)-like permease